MNKGSSISSGNKVSDLTLSDDSDSDSELFGTAVPSSTLKRSTPASSTKPTPLKRRAILANTGSALGTSSASTTVVKPTVKPTDGSTLATNALVSLEPKRTAHILGGSIDRRENLGLRSARFRDRNAQLARKLYKERIEGATLIKMREPKRFNGSLLRHQLMALTWLTSHEFHNGGGMFCDDQGLGKTIMLIALILANSPKGYRNSLSDVTGNGVAIVRSKENTISLAEERKLHRKLTLIVVPLSTLDQWKAEIKKFSGDHLKVLKYYGEDRFNITESALNDADVVLTTYQTLTVDLFPRLSAAEKAKRSSLVKTRFAGASAQDLRARTKDAMVNTESVFLKTHWLRIVLDESHVIRNPNTQTNRALWRLDAAYRWCVSGTPIHNKLGDLYAQLSLTRVPGLVNPAQWKMLENDLKKESYKLDGPSWLTVNNTLGLHMLRRLKTSRDSAGCPLVEIPSKHVVLKRISLSPMEAEEYKLLWSGCLEMFERYKNSDNGIGGHMTSIFAMLCRMRQFCDHPALVGIGIDCKVQDLEEEYIPDTVLDSAEVIDEDGSEQGDKEVPVRRDASAQSVTVSQGLKRLVAKGMGYLGEFKAINQKAKVEKAEKTKSIKSVEDVMRFFDSDAGDGESAEDNFSKDWKPDTWQSSKVSALLEDLLAMKESDPLSSAIVFSQFTMFLDILEIAFSRLAGFRFTRIDGSIDQTQRMKNINEFKTDSKVNVFLVSIKAGGVGLNLMAADYVFILDPWWNPALEHQAIDRVHRIGQSRPVQVIRYFVHSSIEEKIIHLQEKKERMAAGAFGESRIGQKLLSVQEVGQLFKTGKKNKMRVSTDQNVRGDDENEGDDDQSTGEEDYYQSDVEEMVEVIGYEDLEADEDVENDYFDESKQEALFEVARLECIRTAQVAKGELRPVAHAYHHRGIPSLAELSARRILEEVELNQEYLSSLPCEEVEKLMASVSKYVPTSVDLLEAVLSTSNLVKLDIRGDKPQSIPTTLLASIPKRAPDLEVLRMVDFPHLHIDDLKSIVVGLASTLTTIDLSYCGRFVDNDLVKVIANECQYLEALRLDNAYRVTNISLLLKRPGCSQDLKRLSFSHCTELHLDYLQWDRYNVQAITHLDISYATKMGMTSLQLKEFGKVQEQKENKDGESAEDSEVSQFEHNKILSEFFKDCMDLTHLNMSGQSECNLTKTTLDAVASLFNLQELNLAGCEDIDPSIQATFLSDLSATARNLQRLNISRCYSLSGLDALASFYSLVELNVSRLSRIGDGEIEQICLNCTSLEGLYLNTCTSLTTQSLKHIQNNLQSLKKLDISWTKVLGQEVNALARLCDEVGSLRVIRCWGIQLEHKELLEFAETRPAITVIR